MPVRVFASLGVYDQPSDDERNVLLLADKFRGRLAEVLQARHQAVTDYRNAHYPELWEALVETERLYFRIGEIEKRIKAHHSEVRDRNAVPPEMETELKDARAARSAALAAVKTGRAAWSAHLKAFGQWWKNAAEWHKIKSLDVRRKAYAALNPPEELAEYCALHVASDLQERELSREFQERGLHSAIRSEIVEATQPKLKKDGPGIRYRYGRKPEPRPWRKLTIILAGGAAWTDVLAGAVPGLSAKTVYVNHPAGGDEAVLEVEQQIGTADFPRRIVYRMKLDKPLPEGAVVNRWSLVIRENGKREAMPLLADVPAKRSGVAAFGYNLRWTVRPEGIEIAEFRGAHVNERLILPIWLVLKRMALQHRQAVCDGLANDALERVGISRSKKPGSLHGVSALEAYVVEHPTATREGNVLDALRRDLRRADRASKSAAKCIQDVYRSTAAKVCRLHAEVRHPEIDLSKIKRYDTRDLLREDVLPPESRTILQAVAPGKLREAVRMYGLTSVEESPDVPASAPETDLFTSYVNSLGTKTGTRPSGTNRRSDG